MLRSGSFIFTLLACQPGAAGVTLVEHARFLPAIRGIYDVE
jgi:hypothetical protein